MIDGSGDVLECDPARIAFNRLPVQPLSQATSLGGERAVLERQFEPVPDVN